MAALLKPAWIKPSTILFANEVPHNEKAFSFALAQAREFGSHLILFHVYDAPAVAASEASGVLHDDYAAARIEKEQLEPLATRVREAGIKCEVIARPGRPANEILAFTRERQIDRIAMGTCSPAAIGKLFVGSVAEAVVRTAASPVYVIGPEVVDGGYRNFATRSILCAVSLHKAISVVAAFAAELAAQHSARLILQHVIQPQDLAGFDRAEFLAGPCFDDVEAAMLALVPGNLQGQITIQTLVVPGDPTEELLYQSRAQKADLIVLSAHGASAFAATTRHGVVYKTLAHTPCPVITLSPVILTECGSNADKLHRAEPYMAGVF